MMHTVTLASPVGEHAQALAKEFETIRSQKGRVYRTYYRGEARRYLFVTTSKELHVTFGMLSEDGHLHLGQLFEDQLSGINAPAEMLLEAGGAHDDTMIVTVALRPQSVSHYTVF